MKYNTHCPSRIIHFKFNLFSNDCCRVCSDVRTVTKSRSESFIMGHRMRYRLVYETEHVPVAKCCPGYERVGDTCKRELCMETVQGHSMFTITSYSYCYVAICTTPCLNGGVCSSPHFCQCYNGWTGTDCSIGGYISLCVCMPALTYNNIL